MIILQLNFLFVFAVMVNHHHHIVLVIRSEMMSSLETNALVKSEETVLVDTKVTESE